MDFVWQYLIGPWLCSRNDPSREVAASATAAFEVAFPTPAKHPGSMRPFGDRKRWGGGLQPRVYDLNAHLPFCSFVNYNFP